MEMPDYLRINEKEALDYTVEWIRNYFKPLKSKKAVIGLSGGSDSTFTAYACMLGLGKDNVLGVVLPSDSNPKEDENDAYAVARAIGIRAKNHKHFSDNENHREGKPGNKRKKKQGCKGKHKGKA
jgi:NAD synthase